MPKYWLGIGIDIEPLERTPSSRLADHLLNPTERPAWQALAWPDEQIQAQAALRLWTVKEAVWKSCPANADIPLNQVTLNDLAPLQGTATLGDHGSQYQAHYYSMVWQGQWLTLAVCSTAGP